MANQPRQLVNRWRWGIMSDAWEKARVEVASSLRELSRVLGILHSAVEHPSPELQDRVAPPISGSNTSITSTSATNITGASVTYTPVVDGRLLVVASWCIQCTLFGAINQYFRGGLSVNGTQQDQLGITSCSAVNERRTVTQSFVVSVTSGTSYTLQLTGMTDNVATTYDVIRLHSGFTWTVVPNLYKVP